jgi:MFS transporter, ACS family, glucarate transporter
LELDDSHQKARNNWLALGLAAASLALSSGMPIASMPVLFKEISLDMNLDPVQIGLIWGIVSFGSIFVAPLGGILCDKLGTKRTIVILSILSGLVGASRGFTHGFVSLMTTTFLWGVINSSVLPAINLIASNSLERKKQGLAQGILGAGGGFGLILGSFLSATVLSPLLGGWRNVFILFGGINILIAIMWWIFGKEPEHARIANQKEQVSFRKAFSYLFRLKALWLIGLVFLAFQGCIMGMQGYLPFHLQSYGWSTFAVSGVLTIYSAVSTLTVIPLTLLSDRKGSRKFYLFMSLLLAVISVGFMSVVHNELIWVLIFMVAIFAQVNAALSVTMVIETTQVGSMYSGTALGILMSLSLVGRSFCPPIGNSLADISPDISFPFIFWAAIAASGIVFLAFVKETGHKKIN